MTSQPGIFLDRPRLSTLLAGGDDTRLTTVVAPAGYGKTTLLTRWTGRLRTAWHTCTAEDREPRPALDHLAHAVRTALPDLDFTLPPMTGDAHAMSAALCDALGSAELVLVLDDVHVMTQRDDAVRLLEGLCRQLPPTVRLVLSGRRPPPFAVRRLRDGGQLVELTAGDLAFTEEEVAALLTDQLGLCGADSAWLHRVTGGWPIAVRLAGEALRHGHVTDPAQEGEFFDYVATEIVDREPRRTRELVRVAARFSRFRPELLVALGHPYAAETTADLVARGLFVEALPAAPGWFGLLPLVRDFVRTRMSMQDWELRELYDAAARWFRTHGHLAAALAALAELGDLDRIQDLLDERADDLLRQGGADAVLAAVRLVPPRARDRRTWQLAGEAHQVRGDWRNALDCLHRTVENGRTTPQVVRRIAWAHYLSGATAEALEACSRCEPDGADPVSESLLASCAAGARWARGELAACRTAARRAMTLARGCGDAAALAAAHTVHAMLAAAGGDRTALAEHNREGLRHAERAGDVLSEIRIRSNRASHLTETGDYRGALAELEVALPLAELTGFTTYRAFCLNNRGEARLGLGQLDEAVADLVAARDIFTTIDSSHAAVPLTLLADTYRLRGDRVQARTAYEEAIRLAELNATATHLVPALAGLARLLVDDEPAASAELVRRAVKWSGGAGAASAGSHGGSCEERGEGEGRRGQGREAAGQAGKWVAGSGVVSGDGHGGAGGAGRRREQGGEGAGQAGKWGAGAASAGGRGGAGGAGRQRGEVAGEAERCDAGAASVDGRGGAGGAGRRREQRGEGAGQAARWSAGADAASAGGRGGPSGEGREVASQAEKRRAGAASAGGHGGSSGERRRVQRGEAASQTGKWGTGAGAASAGEHGGSSEERGEGRRREQGREVAGQAQKLRAGADAAWAGGPGAEGGERRLHQQGREAVSHTQVGVGFGYPEVLLASAALHLSKGDGAAASEAAGRASRVARERGDNAKLAESLELRARAELLLGSGSALSLVDDAARIWRELGNFRAERRLAAVRATMQGGRETLHIQTLGGFRVLRDGEPVSVTAWQSRKARDLVKILVARRGRSVTREALISLLWPGERLDRAGNRLSVALSTARSVLGPQRGAVVAEGDTVRLDTGVVTVDVLSFLADAQRGLREWRQDRPSAWPLLRMAEAAYTGDFLEEDPYEDWASELREEARLTYVQTAIVLAGHAGRDGEHVTASRYCLRVLERDPYNEPAHLALVRALAAAGSHGEARRRYRTYVARMAEIDIEPRPFPDAVTR